MAHNFQRIFFFAVRDVTSLSAACKYFRLKDNEKKREKLKQNCISSPEIHN